MMSWNSTEGVDIITNGTGNNDFRVYTAGYGTNSERFRITSGGYVGINESSPIHQLSVGINTSILWDSTKNISNTTNNDFIGLNLVNADSGANPEVGIMLQAGSSGSGQYTINCLRTGSTLSDLIFRTRNGGSASKEQLRITSDGLVGIGEQSPDQTLVIRKDSASTSLDNIQLLILETTTLLDIITFVL